MNAAAWRRGVLGIGAVAVLLGAIACEEKKRPRRDDDDEDDRPRRTTASASGSAIVASASATTSATASATAATSGAPVRPDPVLTKTYRARSCRYGAIALKQARDGYVASLKGGPPSASNLPRFVGSNTLHSSPVPIPSSSAKPTPPPPRYYAPRYEPFVRQCSTALSIRDAADPALDAILKEFTDFALPLAKVLGEAATYYAKDEHKADSFAKGKEFHACFTGSGTCHVTSRASSPSSPVTRGFEQLDGKIAKLALALEQFEASHPIDKSKYVDTQKASAKVVAEATAVLMAIDAGASGKPLTDAIARCEAAAAELKAFEGRDPPDTWAKYVGPTASVFLKAASEIAKKTPDAVTDQEVFELAQSYTRMVEKDFTALSAHLRGRSGGSSLRKMGPRIPPGHPKAPDPGDSSDQDPDPP